MYLLVTPAKNEEENIPQLITSVLNQTIKPNLWVIVDDNSDDRTSLLIQDICEKYRWIRSRKITNSSEYDWLGYGRVVKYAFKCAQQIAKDEQVYYNFLGILDADIITSNDYYESLINILKDDSKIGITSGTLYIKHKDTTIPEDNSDSPRGGARLYRRSCFEEIGGFSELPSPDTVSDIKAMNRGWKLTRVKEAKALHNRKSSSTRGLWNGYKKMGEGRYYLNYHPCNAMLSGIYYSTKFPFYQGVAYIYGYFKCYLISSSKTKDEEVQEYFWKSWNRLKERYI
ncbi:glycosyltransferase family 2 protein [Methanohalophilus sp. WG1-DM]|uniref:glycosyltransferase n=1 Tax=Methanohalophilus sp. WG1-DM TaxID=2491675 RepID=UPI000FFF5E5E|nr:glycosyltransferase family A protein [Methanohalophilus sp. WG1-DM]RXG33522.1 glycosyltransferase [Methanohalophilus sp. WG1-DM]